MEVKSSLKEWRKMLNKFQLSLEDANEIVKACKKEALKCSVSVSIAVVDEAGFPIHVERMNGALLKSPDFAILKARSSALTKKSTKDLEQAVNDRPALLGFTDRLAVQGGLPIIYNGQCIGGLGVAGASTADDEKIATAGLEGLAQLLASLK